MALNDITKKALRSAIACNPAANEVITDLELVDGITATYAELNYRNDAQPAYATFSPAAGSANVCEVTVTIKDGTGTAVTKPTIFNLLLSDASTGAGLTATSASGAVTVKASSGAELSILSAKKAFICQTKADGTYVLSITDTGKTGFYVVAQVPGQLPSVSSVLVTGNYG